MEQKNKRKSIKIEIYEEAITGTFVSAIKEVEALNDFYITFRDTWQRNKLEFEEKHKIALKINELISDILNSGNYNNKYEDIKNTIVGDIIFDNVIELIFKVVDNDVNSDKSNLQISYSLKGRYAKSSVYDPNIASSEYLKFEKQYDIFVRSILTNIVIIFERYFAKIFELMVVIHPELYFEGKTIKISDLMCSSLVELISKEVKCLVDSSMYDTIETLNLMKTKNKFDIDRHLKIRDEFEEIYYRRNIFVHNAGVVNDIFIEKIAGKYKTKFKNGERLICDDVYIKNALNVLKKVICVCYYEYIHTNELNPELFNSLAEKVAFSALCNKEYDFCKDIYDMLRKDKRINFADKTMYFVNYMIALKQSGNSIEKLLKEFDVSAMKDTFKLAKECLSDNHQKVYDMLLSVYPNEMDALAIRDWPLFIDFRASQEYEEFKSEHLDDFNQYVFEEQDKGECEADIFEWDDIEDSNIDDSLEWDDIEDLDEGNSLEWNDIEDSDVDEC